MKTVRRLLYGEVVISVLLVTLGFVSLFYFFDFVEELQAVGKHRDTGYTAAQALLSPPVRAAAAAQATKPCAMSCSALRPSPLKYAPISPAPTCASALIKAFLKLSFRLSSKLPP